MFKNTYQSGFLSIMYSCGAQPLAIWEKKVKNGHIRRLTDEDLRSLVIELMGTNVATTYISCPLNPRQSLGIRLPFLIMIVKNMKKYFTFEIQILDDKNMHRRFRVSNFQSTTTVRPFCTTMPICLSTGWNQIQFNLSDFTKRAYGTNYLETVRVQVHANVRIRRVYFSDRLYTEDEMPQEFKLFLPLDSSKTRKPPAKVSKPGKKDKTKKDKKPTAPTEIEIAAPTLVSLTGEVEDEFMPEISFVSSEKIIEYISESQSEAAPEAPSETAPESIAETVPRSEVETNNEFASEDEDETTMPNILEAFSQVPTVVEDETEAESVEEEKQ